MSTVSNRDRYIDNLPNDVLEYIGKNYKEILTRRLRAKKTIIEAATTRLRCKISYFIPGEGCFNSIPAMIEGISKRLEHKHKITSIWNIDTQSDLLPTKSGKDTYLSKTFLRDFLQQIRKDLLCKPGNWKIHGQARPPTQGRSIFRDSPTEPMTFVFKNGKKIVLQIQAFLEQDCKGAIELDPRHHFYGFIEPAVLGLRQ